MLCRKRKQEAKKKKLLTFRIPSETRSWAKADPILLLLSDLHVQAYDETRDRPGAGIPSSMSRQLLTVDCKLVSLFVA